MMTEPNKKDILLTSSEVSKRGWTAELLREHLTPEGSLPLFDYETGEEDGRQPAYRLDTVREKEQQPDVSIAIKENREKRHSENIQKYEKDLEGMKATNASIANWLKESLKEDSKPKSEIFLTSDELEKRGWSLDMIKSKLSFCKTSKGYRLDKVKIAECDPENSPTILAKRFCTQQKNIDDWQKNVVENWCLYRED